MEWAEIFIHSFFSYITNLSDDIVNAFCFAFEIIDNCGHDLFKFLSRFVSSEDGVIAMFLDCTFSTQRLNTAVTPELQ